MNIEELEGKIREFITIAEKLPERYRVKCFEALLNEYLTSKGPREIEAPAPPTKPKFVIPIDVRAFLQQYTLPEEVLEKLFIGTEEGEIRPIYTIKTTKKSKAQIQLALLTALENALGPDGKFEFSIETIRRRCKEHSVYDDSHFMEYFKNNHKFFKDFDDKEHIKLSPDGGL